MSSSENADRDDSPDGPAAADPGDVRNRTLPNPRPPEQKTTWKDVLKDRMGTILGAVLILAGLAAFAGWSIEIPRFWYVYGLSFAFLLPGGWFVASYARNLLPSPEPDWVVDLDARELDGALFKFPPGTVDTFDVPDGQEIEQLASNLYAARGVDLEALELGGTWRGTLSDRELMIALEAVYECRGELEEQARRGFVIEKRFFSLLRNSTRDEVLSVVRSFEEGTLPDDAASLRDNIEKAVEDHGLDSHVKSEPDDFDLSPELTETTGPSGGPLANGDGADE